MIATLKKIIEDIYQDSTDHWCGARFLIMNAGYVLIYNYTTGHCTANDLYIGIGALAMAYAGKDYTERR
jgi:hypothetical protein